MTAPRAPRRAILAFDAGSQVLSAAAVTRDGACHEAHAPAQRSSGSFLPLLEQVLADAGLDFGDLDGVCSLRGPGSFTGIRVGLATLLGLAAALRIPAVGFPTLEVLASLAEGPRVLACVDALRQRWFVQLHRGGERPAAIEDPLLVHADDLAGGAYDAVVGFGASRLVAAAALAADRVVEPQALAAAAARLARDSPDWGGSETARPLYLQGPPVHAAARLPAPRRP